MTHKKMIGALLLSAAAAVAGAKALYRVELHGQPAVFSRDLPVARGSVLLFHRDPGGRLTGVPRELVRLVVPLTGPEAAAIRPLRPGEMISLGPTASPAPAAGGVDGASSAARGMASGGYAYTQTGSGTTGYIQTPYGLVPSGPQGFVAPLGSSGLPTALSGPPPTTDASGRPLVPSGDPPTIGSPGTGVQPGAVGTGVPQGGAQPSGSNPSGSQNPNGQNPDAQNPNGQAPNGSPGQGATGAPSAPPSGSSSAKGS